MSFDYTRFFGVLFFPILFHSNKKKEKVFTAWQLTWCIFAVFDILWSRHQSSELPWKILKSKQHFATSMMNETSDIFPFDYITIQSQYSFLGRACDMAHGMLDHFGPGLNMSTTWNVLQTLTVSRGWILIILMICWGFFLLRHHVVALLVVI